MNRRAQIAMTPAEAIAFLDAQRTVICATVGPDGWPHLMPLWYVADGLELWCWTYGSSQKARNLRRDPRATLQIETGDSYDQLRGVMIESEAVIHADPETKLRVASELARRYDTPPPTTGSQFEKRIAVRFPVRRLVSFDHRKLSAL